MKKKFLCNFKKLCVTTLATLMFVGTTATANTFTDVESGAWYADSVNNMATRGFISGTTTTTFAPSSPLTVGAFATMIARAFYGESVGSTIDLGWWQPYMEGCVARNGLVGTIAENRATWTTTANAAITRYDMAMMVYNLLQAQDVENLTTEEVEIVLYTVTDEIPTQYKEAVATAFAYNFLKGRGDGSFDGNGNLTRAEAATVLESLVDSELITLEQHDSSTLPAEPVTPAPAEPIPEPTPEPTPEPAVVANPTTAEEKAAAALVVAKEIAEVSKTDDTLHTLENAAYIVSAFYYSGVHVESGSDYSTAYGVFVKGESSCAGATRGLGMVLECMGYDWTHVNENQWSHQWCEVTIDGTTYYADGQVGIVGVAPHPFEFM